MKTSAAGIASISWLTLLAITAIGFGSAEVLQPRPLAIIIIGAVAVTKVTIILRRFMILAEAPVGIRAYLTIWSIVCGAMIAGLWIAAG